MLEIEDSDPDKVDGLMALHFAAYRHADNMRDPGSLVTPVAVTTPTTLQGDEIEDAQDTSVALRISNTKPPGALDGTSDAQEFWKNFACFLY
eukprot:12980413-Heterocapsa_arctica.AAC.1